MAFEEGAGVLEVLFGVGFGGGDTLKRFVEDADDPLLFGSGGTGTCKLCQTFASRQCWMPAPLNCLVSVPSRSLWKGGSRETSIAALGLMEAHPVQ